MKSSGDHGAPVPLNWRNPALYISSPVVKSESHESRVAAASRAGTPITRAGMYHGAMPALTPGIPPEMNPPLVLKAVVDPALAGQGSGGDAAARKRDPASGKFAPAQQVGPSSTAEDDAAGREREARLAQRRAGTAGPAKKALGVPEVPWQQQNQQPMLAKPKPQNPMAQAGIPQSPPGMNQQAPGMGGDPSQPGGGGGGEGGGGDQPMTTTPDGQAIYDDPYHPEHSSLTPQHHQFAAQAHQQEAERATMSGRLPSALDHQMKAQIHTDMASDSRSPMERMAGNMSGDQGQGGSPQPGGANAPSNDAMDQFFQMMPDKNPQTAPANAAGGQPPTGATGAMGGQMPDQNKPDFGQPTGQGPKPRMFDTRTQAPVGPQSQHQQHAGTAEQPQQMPPEPAPGDGSQPDISGPQPLDPSTYDPQQWWSPVDDEPTDPGAAGGGAGMPGVGGPAGATAPPSGGGAAGMGAQGAPPTHAGNVTMPVPGVSKPQPADAGGASAPAPGGGGPSTMDKTPATKREASAESGSFTGNPTEERSKQERDETQKSIQQWMETYL